MSRGSIPLVLLALALTAAPVLAEVLVGGSRDLCRSTEEGKIKKAATCDDAGAQKP